MVTGVVKGVKVVREGGESGKEVGCCDIEKISNIDIEKKIPVISIFSIFFCCEIIRMKLGFLFREKH